MAAGVIYQTVTTTTGETVELGFYVDDTVSPTVWTPVTMLRSSAGAALDFTTFTSAQAIAAGASLVTLANDIAMPTGGTAVAFGSAPTAVNAGAQAFLKSTRHGGLFVQPGAPNLVAKTSVITGAQTDFALWAIAASSKLVLTRLSVAADPGNDTSITVRIGLVGTTVPADAELGVTGLLLAAELPAGAFTGQTIPGGMVAVGADAVDLRITCDNPSVNIVVSYAGYEIES
jgi:hypothetical protein